MTANASVWSFRDASFKANATYRSGGSVSWSIVPIHQKAAGSIPGQRVCKRQLINVSLYPRPSAPSSLSKINEGMTSSKDLNK